MSNWSDASAARAMKTGILGPDGNPVQSLQYSACPKCGRAYSTRIPSAGFGEDIHFMCPCGYDFEKRFKCPRPIL